MLAYRSDPGCARFRHRNICRRKVLRRQLALAGRAVLPAHRQTLPARISEVCIQFRSVPHQAFPGAALADSRPNRLVMAIQPEEGILLRFEVKHPGPSMALAPVMMQFYLPRGVQARSPEAYETLLLDVVRGDPTLFMRSDQTEAAWAVIAPILDDVAVGKAHRFPQLPCRKLGA